MDATGLIDLAEKNGVRLNLAPNGKIKISGSQLNIDRWEPELQEHKIKIIEILQMAKIFEKLYTHLAPKYEWGDVDYQAWKSDFKIEPALTIQTLNALKNAYQEGRYQNMCKKDWIPIQKIRQENDQH